MEFFNLRTKKSVTVPDSQIRKRRSVRITSGGKRQERYAVVAEVQVGDKTTQMFKFVNKETFDKLAVPEIK